MNTQNNFTTNKRNGKLSVRELVVFAMLGTVMFISKILMEALPNIHLLGMLTMVYTIIFRKKALIPIYLYVFLNGVYAGFNLWWFPYLYIWPLLWGVTMLLPKNMSKRVARVVYPIVCAAHGLLFGILYAPAQALMFHLSFKQMLLWILGGVPFDILQTVGNFCAGLLVFPLSEALKRVFKAQAKEV